MALKKALWPSKAGLTRARSAWRISAVENGPDGLNSLVSGPAWVTKKACEEPEMAQETGYLARLEEVVAWWFDGGRLALIYPGDADGEFGYLLFEPVKE